MGQGTSRAFMVMAASVQAMMAGMSKAKNKAGQNIFSPAEMLKTTARAAKRLKKIAGGGVMAGKYRPHQGKQECARRRRQAEAGTATPNYVHGDQYIDGYIDLWGCDRGSIYNGKKW